MPLRVRLTKGLGLTEFGVLRLYQSLIAYDLRMRLPVVDSNSNVLIVSNPDLIPVEEADERHRDVTGYAGERMIPVSSVGATINHDWRSIT